MRVRASVCGVGRSGDFEAAGRKDRVQGVMTGGDGKAFAYGVNSQYLGAWALPVCTPWFRVQLWSSQPLGHLFILGHAAASRKARASGKVVAPGRMRICGSELPAVLLWNG